MKYTRNAITQLKRQYKSVLLKCALINAALFMAVSPAMAANGKSISAGTTYNTVATDSGKWFYNSGTINNAVTLGNYSTIENYYGGVFNNLATGVFNNTGSAGFIANTGNFNNAGSIIADDVFNYNAGQFTNTGAIDVEDFEQDYDSDYDEPDGDYDGPFTVNSGTINTNHFDNYDGTVKNDKGGVINGWCYFDNEDTIINAGTVNGLWIENEASFYNAGTVNGVYTIDNDDGHFYNSGNVLTTFLSNENYSVLKNTGTIETQKFTVADVKKLVTEDNLIKYYRHLDSISDSTWNNYTSAQQQQFLEEMITDELEDYPHNYILNQGSLYNGVVATSTIDDGKPMIIDETAIMLSGNPESYLPDSAPQKAEYTYGAGSGTIKSDIMNTYYYYPDMGEASVLSLSPTISSIRPRMSSYENPFGYSTMLWNNGIIEGDIFNTGTMVNGITYTVPMTWDAEEEISVIGEVSFDAVQDAKITSKVIANELGGTIINGGNITASAIYNGFLLENGVVMGYYTSPYMRSAIEVSPSDSSSSESSEMPEPTLLADAIIEADEIYNTGSIMNAGTIKADVYNIGVIPSDSGSELPSYYLYNPSAIALYGGTIDGSVISRGMTSAEGQQLWKEKGLDKFNNIMYDMSPSSVEDEATTDASDTLYGLLQTFTGDNTITGALSADEVVVSPSTTLTVGSGENGGALRANWLRVGVIEAESEGPSPIMDMSVENESSSALTTGSVSTPARLDIGANTATIGEATFGAESALALTVKSETEYGKMIAGKFNIEKGAKLEVTVMPGFSKIKEQFELQLLEQNGKVPETPSEPEFEITDADEDTGSASSATGFNTFADQFTDGYSDEEIAKDENGVIKNNLFEIKRIDDEGNYSFTQLKSAEDLVIEPEPGNSEHAGMAKAWLDDGAMTSPGSLEMQALLARIAQHRPLKEFNEALSALAPNNAAVSQAVTTSVAGRIFGGIGAHLSKPSSGLASGDVLNGISAWGSTYYGNSKLDDRADGVYGFDADSKGVTAGVDKKVTSSVKLGLGLQYDKSDINAFKRDVAVDTTAVFGYGEYRPSNWYVSGVLAYGRSDYDEKKFVGGKTVKANYKSDLFATQALAGYDFATRYADVSPNAGLRYNYVKRHGYNDGANQDISGSNSDLLTGVAGLKVAKSFGGFRPSAYVNFTYDMIADRDNATVRLTNGSSYSISGKRLNKFGTEAGAALEYKYDAWTVTASYDYAGRRHFNSHTGMLTAKYSF